MLVSAQEPCGKPTLCVLKTTIGDPSPTLKGKHEAHGNPFTAEHVTEAKQAMSIPDEPFFAPHDVVSRYREVAAARGESFRDATSGLPAELESIDLAAVRAALPQFASDAQLATRVAIQKVLEATSTALPQLIVGSADLTGNTGVKVSSFASQQKSSPEGRQIYYGIREHAMGAASVGMALHGGTLPVCGTFFVFADYMKPAIRLAALSKAKVVFVFSHDSVGVGEDGPTHQPIEQLASLRSIPGLQVIRPADGAETAQAWISALEFNGPSALVLSRQNLPQTTTGVGATAGFEVFVALEAARTLEQVGIVCRVVSMPSWDLTRSRSLAAFESALAGCGRSFSLEAGSTMGWHEFVDQPIGIDRFGASAPGNVVLDKLGISGSSVSDVIRSALGR
jgi:transketolase